jgi:hypothetical protein
MSGSSGKLVERFAASRREYEVMVCGRQELGDAKLRRARALVDKHELEIQQLRASLVPTAYLRIWSERFVACSRDALSKVVELSEVLADQSDPIECGQILRGWMERTLLRFYELDALWGPTSTRK